MSRGHSNEPRKSNPQFEGEFVEIRNGRDYVMLLQKYGIEWAVQAKDAKELCLKWGTSHKTSEIIEEILKTLERELTRLEIEVEKSD